MKKRHSKKIDKKKTIKKLDDEKYERHFARFIDDLVSVVLKETGDEI